MTMPEIDQEFLKSIQGDLEKQRKPVRHRRHVIQAAVVLGVLVAASLAVWYAVSESKVERTLPPELPPLSPQPTLPVSEKAKETGKNYYEEHPEIQGALADYARRILKGKLDVNSLGASFQPVENFTWDKWYFDTVPLKEGFKTHKNPEPTAHSYTEEHPLITYTITPDDTYGAWGVGIKYSAALGIDLTNPADREICSLIAAYVWLQSQNRMLYEKGNYFDEKGSFDPKRSRMNINFLRPGDVIRFPHLSQEALREIVQSPQKYLEGTAPSVAPGSAPAQPGSP
jgi:hypothetical protein